MIVKADRQSSFSGTAGALTLKGDERILGSSEFVEPALKMAEEEMEKKTTCRARGLDMGSLLQGIAEYYAVDLRKLKGKSKVAGVARARAVFCYLAVEKLDERCASVAKAFAISPSAVSKGMRRGRSIVAGSSVEQALLES